MKNELKVTEFGNGAKTIILVHGGPSLFGYMSTLGEQLKNQFRIVDYAQRGSSGFPCDSKVTIEQHVKDLADLASEYNKEEVILLGHSWGATLILLTLANHSNLASKGVIVGTSPLTNQISDMFGDNLESRYSAQVKSELLLIDEKMGRAKDHQTINEIMNERLSLTSPYYHIDPKTEDFLPKCSWNFISFQETVESLWPLIDSGEIETRLSKIETPIIGFHGDKDPIPYAETEAFLRAYLKNDFNFFSVKNSGHFPWLETSSKDHFLKLLVEEID